MSILAIITARGGSKRIPRKNIKEFMGKPMLFYAISAVLESNIFDEVMVSTDDEEIAEVAVKYGAKVPFIRSQKNSDDFATTTDVLYEVINEYNAKGRFFDEFCCVYPCVPFLTKDILKKAYKKFKCSRDGEALVPVVRYSYPIQRAFRNSNGFLSYREPDNAFVRSQDLEPMYHDAGMFYFVKSMAFMEQKSVICQKTCLFEIDESMVQDIDTNQDFEMAKLKFKILNNRV